LAGPLSSPQMVQLQKFPSASLPDVVHTRMGELEPHGFPPLCTAEQALGPEPLHCRSSFVQ
jgi:hypothetical protein